MINKKDEHHQAEGEADRYSQQAGDCLVTRKYKRRVYGEERGLSQKCTSNMTTPRFEER